MSVIARRFCYFLPVMFNDLIVFIQCISDAVQLIRNRIIGVINLARICPHLIYSQLSRLNIISEAGLCVSRKLLAGCHGNRDA